MARTHAPAPAHLMPVAALLLLWQALMAADSVVTRFALGQVDWPQIMANLPLDALWLKVAWSLAVWLGFAAAFFLLIRDNASVLLFFASGAAGLALAGGLILAGASAPALPLHEPLSLLLAALVVVPFLAWLYARALNRGDVLH